MIFLEEIDVPNTLKVSEEPMTSMETYTVDTIPVYKSVAYHQALDLLKEHGAYLIRGGIHSVEEFEILSDALMTPMVHHATNTKERDPVSHDGSTSTVNKGADAIPFHREGSYAPGCPDILAFYCVRPAATLGYTLLCDGVKLLDLLPQKAKDFFSQTYINWTWTVPRERWTRTLGVESASEAKLKLAKLAEKFQPWEQLSEIHFDGDVLSGRYRTPCAIPTRWGKKPSFCNSLLIHRFRQENEYYAKPLFTPSLDDGSSFPDEYLQIANDVAMKNANVIHWQEGDVLIVDNSKYMHGRTEFDDKNRKVLIRMGYARNNI